MGKKDKRSLREMLTWFTASKNMSSDLLYNGGMTQNYRIETASRAINAGSYTGLGITYDQRNALAGTDYTTRDTIGAYELITIITIDSDVADAALPAEVVNGVALAPPPRAPHAR